MIMNYKALEDLVNILVKKSGTDLSEDIVSHEIQRLEEKKKKLNKEKEKLEEKIGSYDYSLQMEKDKDLNEKSYLEKYIKSLIEEKDASTTVTAFSSDISLLEKGLNDILNVVLTVNSKQGDIISAVADIANSDVENIHFDVSSIIVEIQSIKEFVGQLVCKSDIDALNEKVNYAVSSLSNVKEVLGQISSQVEAQSSAEIKSELQSLSSYFSEIGNEISAAAGQSISDMVESFAGISAIVRDKITSLEKIVKSSKDDVKNGLAENVTRLKEFSQNLVAAISVVSNKMETRNDELETILASSR